MERILYKNLQFFRLSSSLSMFLFLLKFMLGSTSNVSKLSADGTPLLRGARAIMDLVYFACPRSSPTHIQGSYEVKFLEENFSKIYQRKFIVNKTIR